MARAAAVDGRPAPLLRPEPAPVLVRVALANLVVVAAVWTAALGVTRALGADDVQAASAATAVVLGGLVAFVGSTGGSLRSGVERATGLSLAGLPLTLLAIVARPIPVAAGLTLGAAALGAGWLAWHGEPAATLGHVLLFLYFLPLAFGAGEGVPLHQLAAAWVTAAVVVVAVRAAMEVLPDSARPRVQATDEHTEHTRGPGLPPLLPDAQLRPIRRSTLRSALALGVGAFVMSLTRDHNAVWILMTIISVLPPHVPLSLSRVLTRLAGTATAMVVLTVIDVVVPYGYRILAALAGLFVAVAYLRRSYFLSVAGVSVVAVIVYTGSTHDLTVELLARGVDTLVGAAIALTFAVLLPTTSWRAPSPARPTPGE